MINKTIFRTAIDNSLKIMAIVFVLCMLLFGTSEIYKFTRPIGSLKKVQGTLVEKHIEVYRGRGESRFMEYKIFEEPEKIGYRIFSNKFDTTTRMWDPCVFYCNSSIFTGEVLRMEVRRIDVNGVPVFVQRIRPFIGRSILLYFGVLAILIVYLIDRYSAIK